jgi:hypothetical protein
MSENTITRVTKQDIAGASFYAPLVQKLNKGLMVAWINADLLNRAGCDIRKSVVMLDEDYTFVMALPASVTPDEFAARLELLPGTVAAMRRIGIRYWSHGLV